MRVAPELAIRLEYCAGTVTAVEPICRQRMRSDVVAAVGIANGDSPVVGASVVTISSIVPPGATAMTTLTGRLG